MKLAVTVALGTVILYLVALGLEEIRRLARVEKIRQRLAPRVAERPWRGFLDTINARH